MVFKRRDRPPFASRLRQALFPRRGWGRALEYLRYRVQRLPDSPHRIALGCSCGVLASFTPLFGLHFILAAIFARLVRANVLAAMIATVVGNPLTFPLIASVALALGRRILGYGATGRDFGRILEAFNQSARGLGSSLLSLVGRGESHWDRVLVFGRDVMLPYLVGGLLPGLVAAVAAYYLARPLVAAYQTRRRARLGPHRAPRKSKADGGV